MEYIDFGRELNSLSYHGRGILVGRTPDGKKAVIAYFIMGRSENSRNRIFVEDGEGLRTQAFDPAKMTDPHLVIYSPVKVLGNKTIVTNGDQTDTIRDSMDRQLTFEQSLRVREFEDDAPNYTPRISGIVHWGNGDMNYAMSILKSDDGDPRTCLHYTYAYDNPVSGKGRFIHTYSGDEIETPDGKRRLPSFEGEPKKIIIPEKDIDSFAGSIWENLNNDNKVSLFVRYINLQNGEYESRIINKNKKEN